MLTVDIICVGNLKERYWRDACAEYIKRLTPWAKVTVTELMEEHGKADNDSNIEAIIHGEGQRILDAVGKKAYMIALCIEGKKFTSPALSKKLSDVMLAGSSDIAFVIGGSYGLSPAVKARADLKFSMSDLTFPHQLARVMLLEQIYRTLSIMNGTKYHK